MILLYFPVACNKVFSWLMSCLFGHTAFPFIALITRIRYSFPILMPYLVSVLHVPQFLPPGSVASRETFLFPLCQPLYKDDKLHHLSVTALTNNNRLGGLRQHKFIVLLCYVEGQRSNTGLTG